MDLFDDYQDDVERLSHDQIEAIISGEDHSSRPLATLVRDIRTGLLEYPSPEIADRHLAAMARTAAQPELHGAAALEARLGPGSVVPRRRLAAMVVAAALLLVAGLAAAMTLPRKAAQTPQDTVPSTAPAARPDAEDLPEGAAHGQAVADVAKDPSLIGCEKGQAVADVASAKATKNGKDSAEKSDPCARTGNQGKPSHGRPTEVPKGRDPTGRDDSRGGGGRATPESRGAGGAGGHGAGGGLGGSQAGGGPVPEGLPTP